MEDYKIRALVVDLIKTYSRQRNIPASGLGDQIRLEDLGIDSVGVISLLVDLERNIDLDFETTSGLRPPRTVGDVMKVAVTYLRRQAQ
jgi:acyl carrier protein